MTFTVRIESFRKLVEGWLHGPYYRMVSYPAYEKMEQQTKDNEDALMLACFPGAFGIPLPILYYTAKLLPHLEDEFEAWKWWMWDRGSLLEHKSHQYYF